MSRQTAFGSNVSRLLASQGLNQVNVLEGSEVGERMVGSAGDDLMYGRGGNDHLNGGLGRDAIFGDRGADIIISRADGNANDLFAGGRGADTFRFDVSSGNIGSDTILDFSATQGDKLVIEGEGFTADVSWTQSGGKETTLITLLGDGSPTGTAQQLGVIAVNGHLTADDITIDGGSLRGALTSPPSNGAPQPGTEAGGSENPAGSGATAPTNETGSGAPTTPPVTQAPPSGGGTQAPPSGTYSGSPATSPATPSPSTDLSGIHLYVSPDGSDMNDGSVGSPLRTLQAAADAARPGTTVHVAPGVYDEVVHSQVDGTADAPIRFVSDVRGAAVIRPSGADGAVWVNRGDHVTIEGFEIDGSHSPAVRLGIDMQGSHVTVKNNHVHHILINGANDSDGGAGIVLDGARFGQTDQHAIGNLVHDIGADSPRVHGIYHQSTGSVVNNVVYNASQTGIVLWHDAHDVLIANNTVFSNRNGISVGAGDFYQAPSPANNVQVINNLVYDNTGIGIDEEGLTGTGNLYQDNLVYGNAVNWGLQNGLTHTGTITADPQFVNYDPNGGGDYHLRSTSPAIDQGAITGAPNVDIDGFLRSNAPDIGAYEWHL